MGKLRTSDFPYNKEFYCHKQVAKEENKYLQNRMTSGQNNLANILVISWYIINKLAVVHAIVQYAT
jgi:hypothetical protein